MVRQLQDRPLLCASGLRFTSVFQCICDKRFPFSTQDFHHILVPDLNADVMKRGISPQSISCFRVTLFEYVLRLIVPVISVQGQAHVRDVLPFIHECDNTLILLEEIKCHAPVIADEKAVFPECFAKSRDIQPVNLCRVHDLHIRMVFLPVIPGIIEILIKVGYFLQRGQSLSFPLRRDPVNHGGMLLNKVRFHPVADPA